MHLNNKLLIITVLLLEILTFILSYNSLISSHEIDMDIWAEVDRQSTINLQRIHLDIYGHLKWMTDGIKMHGGWYGDIFNY
jgi:hypothetical protein